VALLCLYYNRGISSLLRYKFALEFFAIISGSSEEIWGNENRKVYPSKLIATGSSAEIFKKELAIVLILGVLGFISTNTRTSIGQGYGVTRL
jgi:hypothetical protein